MKKNVIAFVSAGIVIAAIIVLHRAAILNLTLTILLILAAIGFLTLFLLSDYGKKYLASEKTAKMPLPGDDLLKARADRPGHGRWHRHTAPAVPAKRPG